MFYVEVRKRKRKKGHHTCILFTSQCKYWHSLQTCIASTYPDRSRSCLRKQQIWIDSSEFLLSPSINHLTESNESSAMCQKRHPADDKDLSAHDSLSIRGGSDSSLSGRRRDQRVRAPREWNSQGSIPASRTPVVEHNDVHPGYQSIHAILELKCITNFNFSSISGIFFIKHLFIFWKSKGKFIW